MDQIPQCLPVCTFVSIQVGKHCCGFVRVAEVRSKRAGISGLLSHQLGDGSTFIVIHADLSLESCLPSK